MRVLTGVDLLFFEMMCRAAHETRGSAACSAGYPDMLVNEAVLAKALGVDVVRNLPLRKDSSGIVSWHRVGGMMDRVYDSHGVFSALGYQLDVIDIHPVRGGETIIDPTIRSLQAFRGPTISSSTPAPSSTPSI